MTELGEAATKNTVKHKSTFRSNITKNWFDGICHASHKRKTRYCWIIRCNFVRRKKCGKVQDACHDMIRVYVDNTIAFLIFTLGVIINQKSKNGIKD